jgi:hypothetical protein
LNEFAPPRQLHRWGATFFDDTQMDTCLCDCRRTWCLGFLRIVSTVGIRRRKYIGDALGRLSFLQIASCVKSLDEMKHLFLWREGDYFLAIRVHRDYFQSIAQRVVLCWVTLNLFILSFGRGSLLLRVLLWMFLAFGAAVAALLLWRVLA